MPGPGARCSRSRTATWQGAGLIEPNDPDRLARPFATFARRIARGSLSLASVCLAALLASCASLPGPLGARSRDCVPRFDFEGGWLGGDAVYSVPVPGGEARHETIWLFGDSFVGAPDARERAGSAIIHNSVARSRCDAQGRFEVEYAWKRDAQGRPASVFEAMRTPNSAWPFDGFFLGGRLYVPLLEVRQKAQSDALGMAFEIRGTSLARVENPSDPVEHWRVEMRPLGRRETKIVSTAVRVESGFLHLLAAPDRGDGTHPRFLVRIALSAIEDWPADLEARAETFDDLGHWVPGIQPARGRLLMRDNAPEMSVDRDAESGLYFAVYSSPLQTDDDGTPSQAPELDAGSIFVRTAPALTGPWSERRRLHVMSEVLERSDTPSPERRYCYAGKAHAEHSPPGVLVATYVCNLMPGPDDDGWTMLKTLVDRTDLYRPRVVVHPWPLADALPARESAP